MEEWMNLRDEIMFEFHEDILEETVMPDGLVIWFKLYHGFHKKHLTIVEMVKEMFDFSKIHFEVTHGNFFDKDDGTERCETRMLIEYLV